MCACCCLAPREPRKHLGSVISLQSSLTTGQKAASWPQSVQEQTGACTSALHSALLAESPANT